jgi:hypothetical protein
MDDDFELIEVSTAEIRELLRHASPETREAVMFAIGLCNLPPQRVRVPNQSRAVH